VKINIPHMLNGLREMQHHDPRGKRQGRGERLAYWIWKEVLKRPWLYRVSLRLARWLLRPWVRDGWLRRLPGPAKGWTTLRDFPAPAQKSFRQRWVELQHEANPGPT
jgi:L-lactate dehydrogenase complex protein LldF